MAERLRSRLVGARSQSSKDECFIPDAVLEAIMNTQAVSLLVEDNELIQVHQRSQLIRLISCKAIKVMSVLLLIRLEKAIGLFLENEMYDTRLPFERDSPALKAWLGPSQGKDFWSCQWQFLVPHFSQQDMHREFSQETILPFVKEEEITSSTRGKYGKLSKTWIHPNHHDLVNFAGCSQDLAFARKELIPNIPRKLLKKEFDAERYALELLKLVKHDSIIELLASFTQGDSLNFLFPLADMDLDTLFSLEKRPNCWEEDTAFFRAMGGVASGLKTIHNFEHQTPNMSMSLNGFHHDLKPANFLVRGRNILLADFGFSRFIMKDSPRVGWTGGVETYGPPEIDPERRHDPDLDACAVDLWSFGCILVELISYVLRGAAGLNLFRERRSTWQNRSRDDCFHRGKALKLEVSEWIEGLYLMPLAKPSCLQVLGTAQKLLDVEPSRRHTVDISSELVRAAYPFQDVSDLRLRDDEGIEVFPLSLHRAVGRGHVDDAASILDGGADLMEWCEGRLAIHWAVMCGNVDVLDFLLQAALQRGLLASMLRAGDFNGRTAMHMAAGFSESPIIKHLIKCSIQPGLLLDLICASDLEGMTPLHHAADAASLKAAELLLDAVLDTGMREKLLLQKDCRGKIPMHYAAECHNRSLVEMLLDRGGSARAAMIHNCDDFNHTPVGSARRAGFYSLAAWLESGSTSS